MPQRGAKGAAGFGGVAVLFDGSFDVGLEFFIELAVQTIAAKNV
jgi:hypothetical protein